MKRYTLTCLTKKFGILTKNVEVSFYPLTKPKGHMYDKQLESTPGIIE